MKEIDVMKIIEECSKLLDTLKPEEATAENFFSKVHTVAHKYAGVDCLVHTLSVNGTVVRGLCLITDWEPGAVAFQSPDGGLPKVRIVYPNEYMSFMRKARRIFEVSYPELPKED